MCVMKNRFILAAAVAACLAIVGQPFSAAALQSKRQSQISNLLAKNKVIFGWFATARTPEAAAKAAADTQMDFVFLNMEQVQNYKPDEVKAFLKALDNKHPLMARLPIFHDDPTAAVQRIGEMRSLGVDSIVFPDMESGEEARQALKAVGELGSIFIVESEKGIANSREITREKPTVAIPGPGTLRQVFKGDMAKVENAIQTQLASCKEFNVPCGITAGPDDIEKRIKEGFRVIIIYDRNYSETIKVARQATSRE
jgi:hypothetical protein